VGSGVAGYKERRSLSEQKLPNPVLGLRQVQNALDLGRCQEGRGSAPRAHPPPINILKVIMTSAPKLKWVSTASQENIQTPYLTL
jgi:hypothetical protein